jgi:hypothetical protein
VLEQYAGLYGGRFAPAPLILRLSEQGKGFYTVKEGDAEAPQRPQAETVSAR